MDTFLPMAKEALSFFTFTFAELAILFVGISMFVGILQIYIPAEKVKKLLSARQGRGYIVGASLGALTPFCSCSTIPLMIGLLKAKAGFGPTLSFLLTSPLVNPVIIGLFWMTFGLKATLVYGLLAVSMAILISYVLERLNFQRFINHHALTDHATPANTRPLAGTQPANSSCCSQVEPKTPSCADNRCEVQIQTDSTATLTPSIPFASLPWGDIFKQSVQQFKQFLPYVAIGVTIGAVAHGFVPQTFVAQYAGSDSLWAIPIAAIIGVPLYVRVESMIPIAVALMGKGMGLGAVVALIIGGAGASLPEVIMLKRIFKLPLLLAFLVTVFTIAISAGLLFHLLY
ncbi:permease [Magnetococcus sp. PR-3]|uniref:permease n=1 Tax=Magnetococcus sp. PR-3 TaxID=3120355 RepID=UPI002FCE112F